MPPCGEKGECSSVVYFVTKNLSLENNYFFILFYVLRCNDSARSKEQNESFAIIWEIVVLFSTVAGQ